MIFHKLSSLGNNFIVMLDLPSLSRRKVIELCSLESGIGGDGIILLNNAEREMPSVIIYNKDGSRAKMCGNGLKIVGYVMRNILYREDFPMVVATDSGRKTIGYEAGLFYVEVKMPKLLRAKEGNNYIFLNAGNIHAMRIVDSIKEAELIDDAGKSGFDDCNVSLVAKDSERRYRILTHERGVGITASCGSAGLCAFTMLKKHGYGHSILYLSSPGGEQRLSEEGGLLRLSGKVRYCYRGEYHGCE